MVKKKVWMFLAGGVGMALVSGMAGVVLDTRENFGTWSPFTPPTGFGFCGATYTRTGGMPARVTRVQAMQIKQAPQWPDIEWTSATRWLPVGTVGLARWPIYRTTTWSCPESDDRMTGHSLYLKTGPDRYIVMGDSN